MTPDQLVDQCLDLLGPLVIDPKAREELIGHVSAGGNLRWGTEQESDASTERVTETLQLIVSLREYQYA